MITRSPAIDSDESAQPESWIKFDFTYDTGAPVDDADVVTAEYGVGSLLLDLTLQAGDAVSAPNTTASTQPAGETCCWRLDPTPPRKPVQCTNPADFSIITDGANPSDGVTYACTPHVGFMLEAGVSIVTSLAASS